MSANIDTDIRAVIEQKIAEIFPTTPTAWHNVPFKPPGELWIRPLVGYGAEAAIAHGYDQQVGALVVEVFAPISQGNAAVLTAIETIKATFYRQRISGVYFNSILAIRELTEWQNFNGKAIDFAYAATSNF